MDHSRIMRLRIWRALLCATSIEIQEGMAFYEGAHGLCRAASAISRGCITPSTAAGVYAALSPMNGWETNVANMFDVVRYGTLLAQYRTSVALPLVNTPGVNRDKALAIAAGAEPLSILRGRKVRAFYRGISNPDDRTPIPVDRHLICLALGDKLSKNELSRAASDAQLYSRVESVYADLGRREGIGNRLAAIAWFVQRRAERGQELIIDPAAPVCCGRLMNSHGTSPRRFACRVCGKSRTISQRTSIDAASLAIIDSDIRQLIERSGYSITLDPRGWLRVQLGAGHYAATAGGTQYLARFVAMHTTGERLRRDEHVHHSNGDKLDCRRDNLEIWLAERHGRYHARTQLLYMVRDRENGRFVASEASRYAATQASELAEVPF